MITFLTNVGLTRDSLVFFWSKIVSLALLVTSGLLDPHVGLIDPASLGLGPKAIHWIQLISVVVLYLSGQYSTSGLPLSKPSEKAGV